MFSTIKAICMSISMQNLFVRIQRFFIKLFFCFKLNYKRLNLELGIRNHYDIDFYVILKNINFGTIKFQILQNITC